MFRSIDYDFFKQTAPNLLRQCEDLVNGKDNFVNQMSYNGEIMGVPYAGYGSYVPLGIWVRRDWVEERDMTVPEQRMTVDEMRDFFLALIEGRGDDVYAFSPYWAQWCWGTLFGAFGNAPNAWAIIDGKVTYTSTTQEFKEACKYFATWYNLGLIDPETATDARTDVALKIGDGKLAAQIDNPSMIGSVYAALSPDDPNAEVLIQVMSPIGPGGKYGTATTYPNFKGGSWTLFGRNTPDEVVRRILKSKDDFITDFDFYLKIYYGEEGIAYTIEDGTIIGTDLFASTWNAPGKRPDGIGLATILTHIPTGEELFNKTNSPVGVARTQFAMRDRVIGLHTGISFDYDGVNEVYNERGGDIWTVFSTWFYDYLLGRQDVDATWDTYIAELKAVGLDDICAEFERLLIK